MQMPGSEWLYTSAFSTALIGIATVVLLYWYSVRNYDYWKKRGIPYVKPLPFIGSVLDFMRKPLHEVECERYKKFGLVYGHFKANKPWLSVADPQLIKGILVKDFQHFTGRRIFLTNDPIVDKMLLFVRGEDWRRIRSIVTPTFSTGKMKRMLSIFNECAATLQVNIKNSVEEGLSVDVKKLYNAFTMDVIASAAFSTKLDSHNDPDNEFLRVIRKIFGKPPGWKFLIFLAAPWMIKLFKIKVFSPEGINFLEAATLQIIEERKKTGQVRNDFLQLLLDTAQEDTDESTSEKDVSEKDKEKDILYNCGENEARHQMLKTTVSKKLSMQELVAQCVIFFFAGYDTSGSTLSFATHLLALNTDVQEKLRKDVDQAIRKHQGKLTYEAMQEMKYLDNVISETLRMFPPAMRSERLCDSDYVLGDTGIVIEKGVHISIPVIAIHRDPVFYPEPDKFDPDRFTPEQTEGRVPYTYLPFGAGPRNCVGMRFALMQIKVALAMVIAKFKVKSRPENKGQIEFFTSQQGILQTKQALLDLEIREDCPISD